MRRLLFVLFFLPAFAKYSPAQSNIELHVSPLIEQMMQRYISIHKERATVTGWRIQLLATTDRQRMERELQRFRSLYPSLSAQWIHSQPYYKIRVGAFETKLDALRILQLIKQDYPGAYITLDNAIKPEELVY